MALTKVDDVVVDACQAIAQGTVVIGTEKDISLAYEAELLIQLALTSATAHTGTRIKVQCSNAPGAGTENWRDWVTLTTLVGTATSEATTNDPLAVAATSVTVVSTAGFTTNAWRFLADATPANSEWVDQIDYTAGPTIELLEGVTREHAAASVLWDIAEIKTVQLPGWAKRVRVIYDNNWDGDGSTIAVRSALSTVTAY